MNTPDIKCKNCGNDAEGNFCSQCGQSTKIERINLSYLLHNLIYGLFHVDKGIWFTIKGLTFCPGKTIRAYLGGKRVNQFKPFSYLIILSAIYVFLYFSLDLPVYFPDPYDPDPEIAKIDELSEMYTGWIFNHLGIVHLAIIPMTAFLSFLLFRKSGYTYGENLIINTYASGHSVLFSILFLPVIYLLSRLGYDNFILTFPFAFAVQIYIVASVFNMYPVSSRIIKSILWMALQYLALIIIVAIIMSITLFA